MGRLLRAAQAHRAKADQVSAVGEAGSKVPADVHVERAQPVKGHALRLTFSDGAERVVDFGPFLTRSVNPDIRAFLDAKRFASFAVKDGDLVWGDWELCFPIADLYQGRL
jgi:hypothetical protein